MSLGRGIIVRLLSCYLFQVTYFAKKRVYDEYKKKLNTEGFKPKDEQPPQNS